MYSRVVTRMGQGRNPSTATGGPPPFNKGGWGCTVLVCSFLSKNVADFYLHNIDISILI